MLARLERVPAGTDCVFLGNSLVEAGCDPDSFLAAWPDTNQFPAPVNLALGATTSVEHYLILHRLLQRPVRLKRLIYGFSDDQLNAEPRGDWSDLVGNRALSYYFPAEAAEFYAPGSKLKKWELSLAGHIPMFAERSSLWVKVEQARRALGETGMPRKKTNRFGRASDFAGLEPKEAASFNRRCVALLGGHAEFSRPVQEIIRLARERGAQVILVEMPMCSSHRQTFNSTPVWRETRRWLQSLAAKQQATYICASDWVPDDGDFLDGLHLNETGARLFSARLAQAICRSTTGKAVAAVRPTGPN
jgi:hypothetical protein